MLILPPPEIRTIVEKLAAYVMKNGPTFEDKIFEKERQNPRFSFLYPNDPYYAYYQKRLQEFKEGGPEAVEQFLRAAREQEAVAQSVAPQAPVANKEIAKAVPREVAPLEFLIDLPAISALDYDVIKLTAQYVARNGRQFMLNLSQREQRNAQFDFLKPHHSLHAIFLRLVDQYTKIMLPPKALMERLESYATSRARVLERVMDRADYTKYVRDKMHQEEKEAERERLAFAMIDWNDFVVAETIDFGANDRSGDLPKPLDLATIRGMSIMQRRELWSSNTFSGLGLNLTVEARGFDEEVAMDVDEDEHLPPHPQSSSDTLVPLKRAVPLPPADGHHPQIRVRQDYVPRASTISQSQPPAQGTEICPVCQQTIPTSQIEEHMRIEALDPKWREQREAYLAKHRETNLLHSGADVARNLQAMTRAAQLGDQKTRASTANSHVQWDGRAASVSQATREAMQKGKSELLAQMASIQQSGDVSLPSPSAPGPRPAPKQPQQQ